LQEPASKKRKENKYQEYQDFAIRLQTQDPDSTPSTFTLDQLEPREVIVIGDTIEETISAVQNVTNQSSGTLLSRESAVYRAMELSTQRVKKLVADKKKWSEEKVQLTADVERNKRAMLSMTLEMEGMKEELQTYKELPSTLKQRQIDHAQLKEELEKLKAEYQKVTDTLVYQTGLKKDLNQEFFHMHKENKKLKHQIELLKIQHHENLQTARSNRQLTPADQERLQQQQKEVILITNERDELKDMITKAEQHITSQIDHVRALTWGQELCAPPSFSLFRAYELQRNVLLQTLELECYSQLDSSLFDLVWTATKNLENLHNLVCKMIARGDFVLMDPEKLILPIGNLGARVTLYYLTLEEHLHLKRQKDQSEEGHRIVRIPEFGQILEAVPNRSPEQLQEWQAVLEKLRRFFMSQDDLKVKMSYVYQREDVAQRGELTT
jgi:hypothetical protein